MRRALSWRGRRERGAVAVEFGLISIVMLTLIIYIIQFAIWFWAYQVGAHAVREGARLAAVDPCDTAAITDRVQHRLTGAVNGTLPVPSHSISPAPANVSGDVRVGDEVTVGITFSTHEITNGFLPFAMPVINKMATARIENVPAGGGC